MLWTDTAGTLAPSVGKFHFSTRKPRMLRLNPNPFFRTLSVCGPPSGEMEVIHSAETHHPNPISSLPQQEIITSIKAVRTGGERALCLKLCCRPWKYRLSGGISAGRTQAKVLFKTKKVC